MSSGRYWRKHQKKELEAVLQAFHEADWKISDPPKYYTVRCPCGEHQRTVHLTPSTARYAKNVLMWLKRQTCYRGKGER